MQRRFKFEQCKPLQLATSGPRKAAHPRENHMHLLNALRALLNAPPAPEETAFREQLLRYASRRQLQHQAPDLRLLIGAVVADVFVQANVSEHLTSRADTRTSIVRAAFACYGLAVRAGLNFHIEMIETAAHGLGAPRPATKALRAVMWDALNVIEEQRIYGAHPEQPEEIMVPRYVRREEPLVLKHLGDQLLRQLRVARNEDQALGGASSRP